MVFLAASHSSASGYFGRICNGRMLGVAILVNLCGSLGMTIHIYQLLVSKAAVLSYAIKTGDGPWYRYLVDLSLVSPIILLLAFGAIFTLKRTDSAEIFS